MNRSLRACARSSVQLLVLFVWPLLIAASCDEASKAPRANLVLVSADGKAHEFRVEVMRTETELWTGLRGREELPKGEGMLFDLGDVRSAYFTMEDTLIPLDIVFIGADGRIVNIEAKTVPGTLGPYMSRRPVRAVLEVNAGVTQKLGIKSGDRVRYMLFSETDSR